MKVDILLGLQWGDEGKGKVVDVLTPRYDLVARFQGGPNAGHTLEFDGRKVVLRSIPSGVFQGNINVIGNGVVLDPVLFASEAQELIDAGTDLHSILKISKKAHLILPTHRLLDAAGEKAKGASKIGTTGKGIGPTYTDKISRNGLRAGDLLEPDFRERFDAAINRHLQRLADLGATPAKEELDQLIDNWMKAAKVLRSFQLIDSEHYINAKIRQGRRLLCEGAQGTMLDVDFGSYPFVTSSNTISAGAYCTRVGSGPFPTELFDETGDKIRQVGHEYGAVTGRERRCGWIDLVALRYAIMLNGVTKLIMMKSDVLDQFDTIRACTAYEVDGQETRDFPYSIDDTSRVKPIYHDIKGWKTDLTHITSADQFPAELTNYIKFLENELHVPICIVSVGPDRKQTIEL